MTDQLKPWDGTSDNTYIKYNINGDPFQLWQDGNGTIYYTDTNGSLQIWCPASRLAAHLIRLYQIGRATT